MDQQDETDINVFEPKSPKNKTNLPINRPGATLPNLDLEIDSLYYKMDHGKRGLAIIFNHYTFDDRKLANRNGTHVDASALEKTFLSMNFQVQVYTDYTLSQICEVLTAAQRMDHSDSDCLLITVLSHGELKYIHAKDMEYESEMLWMPFTGDNCPSLAGKPKIFFIQACRGDDTDAGVKIKTRVSVSDIQTDSGISNFAPKHEIHVIPKMADLLIMYATFAGHVSYRNPLSGSWFVENLCQQLQEKVLTYDLQTILTIVNQKVATLYKSNCPSNAEFDQKKQVGVIVSTLIRLIHFKC